MKSRDDTDHPGDPPRIAPRRAPAPAARLRRSDAERARRRPLLEGVRLADRARQDAADARDDQVARLAARRRRLVPRERRLERRACSRRGDPHARRGALRAPRLRRRDRRVHGRARGRRRHRRGRPAGAGALGRGVGPRTSRRGQARDRPARAGARPRRRAVLHRSRPRRDPLPPRRLPLPDLEHLDRDGALRASRSRWSTARRSRPTCSASNILTWRSRCYRRQRDYEAAREDVARALELAESMSDARALGEVYFQASLIAERDGHWVLARTYAERAKAAVRGADRPHLRRQAAQQPRRASSSCSASPTRRSPASTSRSRSRSSTGTTSTSRSTTSSLAQIHLRTGDPVKAEEHARQALELLGGARGPPGRDRQRAPRPRTLAARAGPPRGGRGRARRSRGRTRTAFIRLAPSRSMGGAGRSRAEARRRPPRSHPLPAAAETLQDFRF